jgi:hypothetical protein
LKENFLYPNPSTIVLFFCEKTEKVKISIFDITGKLIFNKQITDNMIDISSYRNGVYSIKIEGAKGIVIRKFVKQ